MIKHPSTNKSKLSSDEKTLAAKLAETTKKKFNEGQYTKFEDQFWSEFSKLDVDSSSKSQSSFTTLLNSVIRSVSDRLHGFGFQFNLDFAYGVTACSIILLGSISMLKTQEPMHVAISRQDHNMVAVNEGLLKDLDMMEDMAEIVADADVSIEDISEEEWDILTL